MAPLKIPSYITDYLPDFVLDYLQGYATDDFPHYIKGYLPHHVKDYIPHNIEDCKRFLDTIQNQCVPLSSVVTAIIIYGAIALLLSWYA